MEMRELGNTGMAMPALGLGCMGLVGWYGERDDNEARSTVARALDLGMNHLDTAAVYQDGENERFVGDCIRGRRNEVFLATKCGLARSADGKIEVDNRPETIRQSCDASLLRLGVDHIDLFYLHRVDTAVPLEDSLGAMADLVAAGKLRYVGISEVGADSLRRARSIYPIAALQSELSIWSRRDAEACLGVCRELGIGFVAYSPLGRGFLTGGLAQLEDLPSHDTRRLFPRFEEKNLTANQPVAERMRLLARHYDSTPAQLALAWVLAQWQGVLPIPGTKHRSYLEDNLGALQLELSSADLDHITGQFPEDEVRGSRYPESMADLINV